jgi:putative integral membrane protein (TIGR02587 family)
VRAITYTVHSVSRSGSWYEELRGLIRALSGAYLFGMPLLYTMEMWWLGEVSRPGHLLLTLMIALLANFGLVAAAGFKHESETTWFSRVEQTLEAVAVGTVAAVVVLLTLNQIKVDQSPQAILGMIVLQALPLSIGASLANILFDREMGREGDELGSRHPTFWHALLNDVSATAIGATFIAATVAPTEEVPMLAARMDYPHLLALIGLTLVTGYIVVFASGFDASAQRDREHLFQHPATETALSYLVALIVSFCALLLTQQVGQDTPPGYVLTQTLVLGLPAMIGGAAGRIAV